MLTPILNYDPTRLVMSTSPSDTPARLEQGRPAPRRANGPLKCPPAAPQGARRLQTRGLLGCQGPGSHRPGARRGGHTRGPSRRLRRGIIMVLQVDASGFSSWRGPGHWQVGAGDSDHASAGEPRPQARALRACALASPGGAQGLPPRSRYRQLESLRRLGPMRAESGTVAAAAACLSGTRNVPKKGLLPVRIVPSACVRPLPEAISDHHDQR